MFSLWYTNMINRENTSPEKPKQTVFVTPLWAGMEYFAIVLNVETVNIISKCISMHNVSSCMGLHQTKEPAAHKAQDHAINLNINRKHSYNFVLS